ncbi:hypothetical protein CDFC105_93906 [Clostridioides difficile]|nr:hypothetical protein CDFC105_93906 [Clostridioides difficile]
MFTVFFFLMIRRPPRSTLSSSSAASDVYKRQIAMCVVIASHYYLQGETSIKWILNEAGIFAVGTGIGVLINCLLYTSPSPRDRQKSRMPSSA